MSGLIKLFLETMHSVLLMSGGPQLTESMQGTVFLPLL